jgi:hypothetical protein
MNELICKDRTDHAEQGGYPCTILTSSDSSRARLGWVSDSTGLTYCGLCLRAPIAPKVGSTCLACGARVAHVVDLFAGPHTMRQALETLQEKAPKRHARS